MIGVNLTGFFWLTQRRCHSTVRADKNNWAPISGLARVELPFNRLGPVAKSGDDKPVPHQRAASPSAPINTAAPQASSSR
jgi:hypothetical protein